MWTCVDMCVLYIYRQFTGNLDIQKYIKYIESKGFLGGSAVQSLPASADDARDSWVWSWVGKIPWRRAGQPTPVFFPGESHGQRSLVGYSPWGHKESDTTERLTQPLHLNSVFRGNVIWKQAGHTADTIPVDSWHLST